VLGDYGALAAVVTFGMAVLAASIQRNRAPPPLVA
jgi:hypothetical protein